MKDLLINEELKLFENLVLNITGQKITQVTPDQDSEEYCGFNFQINTFNLKFRKAKITPKKTGQFVTLWKRNSTKQTEPFHENDLFDFYIIFTKQQENFGFFIFPKKVLADKRILTTKLKQGKRGFRIYPDWTKIENKQAEKTQSWQKNYFINLIDEETKNILKFKSIINATAQ